MSVYLVVERAREGCLRMLFKKAYVLFKPFSERPFSLIRRVRAKASWTVSDKSTRIPISTFQLALSIHQINVDSDEVECMVANMIYRVSSHNRLFFASFAEL